MKHQATCTLLLCLSVSMPTAAQTLWPYEGLEVGTKICRHEFQLIEWIDTNTKSPPEGCERIKEKMWGNVDIRAPYPVKVPLGDLFTFTRIMPNGETEVRFGIRYYGEPA